LRELVKSSRGQSITENKASPLPMQNKVCDQSFVVRARKGDSFSLRSKENSGDPKVGRGLPGNSRRRCESGIYTCSIDNFPVP
jgi:hypothetical protein